MSLGLFISAFPAAIFGWLIWNNVTLLTENARLRYIQPGPPGHAG